MSPTSQDPTPNQIETDIDRRLRSIRDANHEYAKTFTQRFRNGDKLSPGESFAKRDTSQERLPSPWPSAPVNNSGSSRIRYDKVITGLPTETDLKGLGERRWSEAMALVAQRMSEALTQQSLGLITPPPAEPLPWSAEAVQQATGGETESIWLFPGFNTVIATPPIKGDLFDQHQRVSDAAKYADEQNESPVIEYPPAMAATNELFSYTTLQAVAQRVRDLAGWSTDTIYVASVTPEGEDALYELHGWPEEPQGLPPHARIAGIPVYGDPEVFGRFLAQAQAQAQASTMRPVKARLYDLQP